MVENWDSYFCNVNGVLASIFLNLELRNSSPDSKKPNLLWVWVYMKSPRHDGLSSSEEFKILSAIEDQLTSMMARKFDALFCGRITTDGRREFYYYAPRPAELDPALEEMLQQFQGYEFDCGCKEDSGWTQYLDVLFPSEENRQRMENRKLLEVLQKEGDTLERPRDVWHWIYFQTETDREKFLSAITPLEYRLQSRSEVEDREYPKGICIVRFQSVKLAEINDAVIELFRFAQYHNGDYDGWETEVNPY
jgi:uncharacterized protein (TIGR01619 family)